MDLVSFRNKFAAAKAAATGAVIGSLFAANSVMAQAATLDLAGAQTTVLGYVTATVAFIVAIGIAVLGLVMVAKAIRWARKAG